MVGVVSPPYTRHSTGIILICQQIDQLFLVLSTVFVIYFQSQN